ncbi:hypothetical protein [Bradyrhizobium sp. RDT46]|uniref:hypothetical protein n=1 Tax=Bradyrhizobium sp. RDT46 TaxID=3341829 RepID=UPI0035C6DA99
MTKSEVYSRSANFAKNTANGAAALLEMEAAAVAFGSSVVTGPFGIAGGLTLTLHASLSLSSSIVLGVSSIFLDQGNYEKLEQSLNVISLPGIVTLLGAEVFSATTGSDFDFDATSEVAGYANAMMDSADFLKTATKFEPVFGTARKAAKGWSLLSGGGATYSLLGSGSKKTSSDQGQSRQVQPASKPTPKPSPKPARSEPRGDRLFRERDMIRNVDDARGTREIQDRQRDRISPSGGGGRSYYA